MNFHYYNDLLPSLLLLVGSETTGTVDFFTFRLWRKSQNVCSGLSQSRPFKLHLIVIANFNAYGFSVIHVSILKKYLRKKANDHGYSASITSRRGAANIGSSKVGESTKKDEIVIPDVAFRPSMEGENFLTSRGQGYAFIFGTTKY
jgi:hypothetical protein